MLTESWCPMRFEMPVSCRTSLDGPEEQPYLAKVLEVPPQRALVHARSQASHKDFLGALWIDAVQAPSGWLFFLWYSLLRLDLAPEV